MLDRLQGRFPTEGAADASADRADDREELHGLHGSPTLDESPFGGAGDPQGDVAPWSDAPTDEAPRGGIFSRRPEREDVPLTGGKALALRLLAVACIAGGLFLGWRTFRTPSTTTTSVPTESSVATAPPATVVSEVAEVPADVTVAPDPLAAVPSADATVDPSADPAAGTVVGNPTPDASTTDASTTDAGGDFFEAPKDYSAR